MIETDPGSRSEPPQTWIGEHGLEAALYGLLAILTLVMALVSGFTLLEFLSHPMPFGTGIGTILYIVSAVIQLLMVFLITPTMLNRTAKQADAGQLKMDFALALLLRVGALTLWTFVATLAPLMMAYLLGGIAFRAIPAMMLMLLVTALWSSSLGMYLYSVTGKRVSAALWAFFVMLVMSLLYPVLVIVAGFLLVNMGSYDLATEVTITAMIFEALNLSPAAAFVYHGFTFQEGVLAVAESHFVGQTRAVILPWVIYSAFWGMVGLALLVMSGRPST